MISPLLNIAAALSGAQAPAAEDALIGQLRYYGSCIVTVYPTRAILLLNTERGTKLERTRLRRFVKSARRGGFCWPTHQTPRLTATLIRGALAEALYLRIPRSVTAPMLKAAAAPAEIRTANDIHEFARCVVSMNVPGVDTLLRTRAVTGYSPLGEFSRCGPDWQRMWTPVSIRAALAEEIYARASAWRRATAAGNLKENPQLVRPGIEEGI
ncbi:MAG TPA: hypothetical protein VNT25_01485 [Allosphingosinicella sp.]|nr:hypothetical protein [Allosphingosinicella sp.]